MTRGSLRTTTRRRHGVASCAERRTGSRQTCRSFIFLCRFPKLQKTVDMHDGCFFPFPFQFPFFLFRFFLFLDILLICLLARAACVFACEPHQDNCYLPTTCTRMIPPFFEVTFVLLSCLGDICCAWLCLVMFYSVSTLHLFNPFSVLFLVFLCQYVRKSWWF